MEEVKEKKETGKLSTVLGVQIPHRMVNVVVGNMASGKTEETMKVIRKYIHRYTWDKVLILDAFDEYKNYREIKPEQIEKFRKPSRINMTKHKFLDVQKYLNTFKRGLLVVECGDYYKKIDEMKYLHSLSTHCGSMDIDVIFISQKLEGVDFRILANTPVIRFHKTFDIQERHFESINAIFPDKYVIAKDAVNFSLNKKYPFCYFDVANEKVLGADPFNLYCACVNYFTPKIEKFAEDISKY